MLLCVEKIDKLFILLEIINAADHTSKFLQKDKFTPIHSLRGGGRREGMTAQNSFTFYLRRTVQMKISFSSFSVNSSYIMTRPRRNESQKGGVCLSVWIGINILEVSWQEETNSNLS